MSTQIGRERKTIIEIASTYNSSCTCSATYPLQAFVRLLVVAESPFLSYAHSPSAAAWSGELHTSSVCRRSALLLNHSSGSSEALATHRLPDSRAKVCSHAFLT